MDLLGVLIDIIPCQGPIFRYTQMWRVKLSSYLAPITPVNVTVASYRNPRLSSLGLVTAQFACNVHLNKSFCLFSDNEISAAIWQNLSDVTATRYALIYIYIQGFELPLENPMNAPPNGLIDRIRPLNSAQHYTEYMEKMPAMFGQHVIHSLVYKNASKNFGKLLSNRKVICNDFCWLNSTALWTLWTDCHVIDNTSPFEYGQWTELQWEQ